MSSLWFKLCSIPFNFAMYKLSSKRHKNVSRSKKIITCPFTYGYPTLKAFFSMVWSRTVMIVFGLFLFISPVVVKANNIAVSSIALSGQDTAANHTQVRFSISWQNSWRTAAAPANWDAAWVFVKFCVGESDPVITGVNLSAGQNTLTVASLTNLRVGMPVFVSSGVGSFPVNTVISSINPVTLQITFSNAPLVALSGAQLTFSRIWEHAELSTNSANHITAGSEIVASPDGKGVFIQRSAAGTGNLAFAGVGLRWNYGSNNLPDFAHIQVRVFAVEMVFIPQGAFFVGSGGTEAGSFTNGSWVAGNSIPFQIASENQLNIAQTAGSLWGTSNAGAQTIGPAGVLPADFPKGFGAFYCMKYEVSQAQYRDFLNCLTRTQQTNRILTDGVVGRYAGGQTYNGTTWSAELNNRTTPGNRIGLRLVADPGGISPRTFACDLITSATLPTWVNQTNDGEWIAMGQLTWMDCCAYLDWAGLRPMTELEFEKICRGNQPAVANEYAWGNAVVTAAANLWLAGTDGEYSFTANSNAVFNNGTGGLMRVGNFARAATNRVQSGAAYYGVMEMSGNAWEQTVTVGNNQGRNFTGLHGDGSLTVSGNANVGNWPGLNSGEVTGHLGAGVRGGDAFMPTVQVQNLAVSSRIYAVTEPATVPARASHIGCRGVRSIP